MRKNHSKIVCIKLVHLPHLESCAVYEACATETCLRTIMGDSCETAKITAGIYTGVP